MSRGPVLLAPTRCTATELKDLADTVDFDQNGEVGETYGFQYTEDGFYKRVEVSEDRKIPRLEQLRNVLGENFYDNIEYKLKRKDNKWSLIPSIDWEVKFEFLSPYTLFANNRNFRKSLNEGPMLVSLIPDDNSRREIEIKQFNKKQYLIHRKESVTKNAVTKVNFLPKIPVSNEFTMILDISVRSNVKSISDVLMRGVKISWRDLTEETLRISVAIQSDSREIKSFVSSDNVVLTVTQIDELEFINLTHLDLIGFYFTDRVLPEDLLTSLTTDYSY